MQKETRFLGKMRQTVFRFAAAEGAATAIEYALVASGIAVAIAGTVVGLGSELRDQLYKKILDSYPT